MTRNAPDLGPTPASRSTTDTDATGINPDLDDDRGHDVATLACPEGEHDWIKTSCAVGRDRPAHRRGWPRLRPAPLKCQICGFRLQTIAFTTDQDPEP